ncbi:hypothetical protein IU501_10840 [Nocardia otitidiscaviarum]|uniref:MerR family transcriptional regulator n=1 Tax=Nocardia otitidiscaviarum TaxID=1823 RepID=UPI001895EEC9|nr:MerR family transcriptional regulator [Nocardia otitidiscaviarum]MBF6133495.1 hypothetical protein [Nocardia otitidiscaviarum]
MAGTALDNTTGIHDLIPATDAARLCGVTTAAITNWVSRGHLCPVGLDERGRKLYRVLDVALAERATRDHPAARSRRA